VGGLYQRFTAYEGAELVRDLVTMLYEVGGAVNIICTVPHHADLDTNTRLVRSHNASLDMAYSRLKIRQEALERALESLVGEGLRLPGFLTTVGSDSPDAALATGFVRRLECSFAACPWVATVGNMDGRRLLDTIGVLLNTMSDVLFALDYRSRSDCKQYWTGFGDL
jgi:hypothetical protein